MNYFFRFSELFDGHICVDDLVESVYGVPYIEIKAKSDVEAITMIYMKL